MPAQPVPGPRSLGALISRTKIPANTLGIFWPGETNLVLKSVQQRVYMFDPTSTIGTGGSRLGTIDIRPDLVFSSVAPGARLDLSAMTHLASAFPDTLFVGSPTSRDAMIGRHAHEPTDEIPIDPARVHALEHDLRLDVRKIGVSDTFRIHILPGPDGSAAQPWNMLLSFAGIHVCVIQHLPDGDHCQAVANAVRRQIDVLLWALPGAQIAVAGDLLQALRPGYAIPFAYDRLPSGRELARQFRDLAAQTPGVKTYLFAEDYMEGLLYSRRISRKSRLD
jgi:hypothetical protein